MACSEWAVSTLWGRLGHTWLGCVWLRLFGCALFTLCYAKVTHLHSGDTNLRRTAWNCFSVEHRSPVNSLQDSVVQRLSRGEFMGLTNFVVIWATDLPILSCLGPATPMARYKRLEIVEWWWHVFWVWTNVGQVLSFSLSNLESETNPFLGLW